MSYLDLRCIPKPQFNWLFNLYSEPLIVNNPMLFVLPKSEEGLAQVVIPVLSQDWAGIEKDKMTTKPVSSYIHVPSGCKVDWCFGG